MPPHLIDNLGLVICLDAMIFDAARKLLRDKNTPEAIRINALADYNKAKNAFMLDALYGIRGFIPLRPPSMRDKAAVAVEDSIAGIEGFYAAIGNVMIPTIENMAASFQRFAQSLNQASRSLLGIRSPSQETLDWLQQSGTDMADAFNDGSLPRN